MIVFMGVAGAGKSVQGKLLAEKLGVEWLSIGELLRKEINDERKEEMIKGKLLDDDEIIEVVSKYLSEHSQAAKNCILDGFPRTIIQADWLLDQISAGKINVDAVIHLYASKEIVKKRLLERGRPDDNEEAISVRFEEYEKHTLPIVEKFKQSGIAIHNVDGDSDIESIHHQILEKIDS